MKPSLLAVLAMLLGASPGWSHFAEKPVQHRPTHGAHSNNPSQPGQSRIITGAGQLKGLIPAPPGVIAPGRLGDVETDWRAAVQAPGQTAFPQTANPGPAPEVRVNDKLVPIEKALEKTGDLQDQAPLGTRGAGEALQTALGGGTLEADWATMVETAGDGDAATLKGFPGLSARATTRPARRAAELERLKALAASWTLGQDLKPFDAADPQEREAATLMEALAQSANAQYRDAAADFLLILKALVHDINNHLSPLGFIELIIGRALPEKAEEVSRLLAQAIALIRDTATTYISMARMESGAFELSREGTDLASVMREAAKGQGLSAQDKQVRLEFVRSDGVPLVYADPKALGQVGANLIGNALKYTPAGGLVTVRVLPDPARPGWARVEVEDNGIGIDARDTEKIFRGFRTEQGRKKATGTGIGLQVVRKIIEAHGSSIGVARAPVKGTIFAFSLPPWEGQ